MIECDRRAIVELLTSLIARDTKKHQSVTALLTADHDVSGKYFRCDQPRRNTHRNLWSSVSSSIDDVLDSVDGGGALDPITDSLLMRLDSSQLYVCVEDGKPLCRTLKIHDQRFVMKITTAVNTFERMKIVTIKTQNDEFLSAANDGSSIDVQYNSAPVEYFKGTDRRCFEQKAVGDCFVFRSIVANRSCLAFGKDRSLVVKPYEDYETPKRLNFLFKLIKPES